MNIFENYNNLETAQKIRDHFTNICTKHPAIDPTRLPSYLPAQDDLPIIERMTVYQELIKLKLTKASPPDKLLKEFAYEFSQPIAHIFNLSLR